MAAKSLLLPTATLCFLVLVFAAQGKVVDTADPAAILFIHGIAQCESDPPRIITNTTLKLVVGDDEVAIPGDTGITSSTGQVAITAKLTSKKQVDSLMKGKGYLVAPPHACGAPRLPPGKVVAARVNVTSVFSAAGGAGGEQSPISSILAASSDDGLTISGHLHATNKGDAGREDSPTIAASDGLCIVISWIRGFRCMSL